MGYTAYSTRHHHACYLSITNDTVKFQNDLIDLAGYPNIVMIVIFKPKLLNQIVHFLSIF